MLNNIPFHIPYFDKDDEEAVAERIRSTWVIGDGEKCKEFEKEFAKYLGVKHAFLTPSCTAALHLAFMAADIKSGEVVVPDWTFGSSAFAPILSGAAVKFCDVENETGNIDIDSFKNAITEKTRAVVPVDYAGYPCKIDEIMNIAKERNLIVVHDAAQSCGSKIRGIKVGSQAHITCFSFHATKNLATGEGGCLVTNDDKIAERAIIIREKGKKFTTPADKEKYGYYGAWDQPLLGHSYVQSDILGALALSQLRKLDWMNARRKEHADYLTKHLGGIKDLELPFVEDDRETNWHLYYIRVPAEKRFAIREAFIAEGVGCETHYRPLHQYTYFKNLFNYPDSMFPGATNFSQSILRLPMYPGLERSQLDRIIIVARKIFSNLDKL